MTEPTFTPPVAALPSGWLDVLPAPARGASAEPVAVEYEEIDTATLRQRIADLARGKRADEWGVMRRALVGERLFRIEGGPGDASLPLVHGVDEFLSKRVIWTLANEIPTAPPDEIAAVFEPSLSILRSDVASLGAASAWTADHLASKWIRASSKAEAENVGARDFIARLEASAAEGAEARESALPLVVQFDERYYALDDREGGGARYEGPLPGAALRAMLRELWGDRRVLDVDGPKGETKAMAPAQIVETYGRAVSSVVVEYAATRPRVEDLTLVMPRATKTTEPAPPREDAEVAEWLDVLDPSGGLLDWIAYARPDRCASTVPALALIGGAHVGKSLLADALARAAGMRKATPLGRVLGRFRAALASGPVLFAGEGLPRDPRTGIPLTEEFREILTDMDHVIEQKGADRSVYVRGGVRAILAANRMDRLFSNRGTYSGHDVDALVRRLFVVEISDDAAIARAAKLAIGLGTVEGDPVRLERVAGHLAFVQATRTATYPHPRARSVERALRLGGDLAKKALDVLEDALGSSSPPDWIVRDDAEGVLWVKIKPWISSLHEDTIAPIARGLSAYVKVPSERKRTHPGTKLPDPNRERWIGLDLVRLIADGVDL